MEITELDKLKGVFTELEIPFVVRTRDNFSYLFQGEPEHAADIKWMDDNFVTTDLDTLTMRNKFFEFEDNKLVSFS